MSRHLRQGWIAGGDHCAGRRAKALHMFLPAKQRSSNGGREVNGHEMMESYGILRPLGGWKVGRSVGFFNLRVFCLVLED